MQAYINFLTVIAKICMISCSLFKSKPHQVTNSTKPLSGFIFKDREKKILDKIFADLPINREIPES